MIFCLVACNWFVIEGFQVKSFSLGQLGSRPLSSMRIHGRAERRMQKKASKGKLVDQTVENSIEPEDVDDDDDDDDETRGFGSPSAGQGQVVETDAVVIESEQAIEKTPADPEAQLDNIFKKYGIEESKASQAMEAQKRALKAGKAPTPEGGAFGEAALSKIDDKLQQQIDDTLISLTFGSLLFCVLCGLAISSSAIEVVIPDFKMDSNVDHILKDVLTPLFTPSLGIFFLFSITFGIFKFAQVSSQATVYTEESQKK